MSTTPCSSASMQYDKRTRVGVLVLLLLLPFLLLHLTLLFQGTSLQELPRTIIDIGGKNLAEGTVGRKALSDPGTHSSPEGEASGWWAEQEARRRHLAWRCRLLAVRQTPLSALWATKEGHQHLQHLLVDDTHRVLYCYVPKVGCTNWKRLYMILTGRSNASQPQDIPSSVPHQANSLRRLGGGGYTTKDIQLRLETYKKFLFVREPMERLVSAFRNKLEQESNSSLAFRKAYGPEILRMFRKTHDKNSSGGNEVTFSEFVRFILERKQRRRESLNEHWAPYTELCHPCIVPYDYIGKFETLHWDARHILHAIGAPQGLRFPPRQESVTASLIPQYLSTLLPSEQRRLYAMYQADALLFGYGSPPIRNITKKSR